MSITNPITQPHLVNTVLGPLSHLVFGITDAHNHVWIDPIDGAAKGSPVLNDQEMITRELGEYIKAGGKTILDCQPGGCGRDANLLMDLSITSGVNHHRMYRFPPPQVLSSKQFLLEVVGTKMDRLPDQ